jgi:hypothetical protein
MEKNAATEQNKVGVLDLVGIIIGENTLVSLIAKNKNHPSKKRIPLLY